MYLTAIQVSERLSKLSEQLFTPCFQEQCALKEITLKNRNVSSFYLAEKFAQPIRNFADILFHSGLPADSHLYDKLYSFTDASILVGFKASIKHSIEQLAKEGELLYNVPDDDIEFLNEYIFIGFF